jgi:WD40 repeat protein
VDQREGAELPVTHEAIMKDHTKVRSYEIGTRAEGDADLVTPKQTVSALSIDPSGSRVASGSYDYDCKLWDFAGMSSAFKPFRSWEVKEGHQVSRAGGARVRTQEPDYNASDRFTTSNFRRRVTRSSLLPDPTSQSCLTVMEWRCTFACRGAREAPR